MVCNSIGIHLGFGLPVLSLVLYSGFYILIKTKTNRVAIGIKFCTVLLSPPILSLHVEFFSANNTGFYGLECSVTLSYLKEEQTPGSKPWHIEIGFLSWFCLLGNLLFCLYISCAIGFSVLALCYFNLCN